MNSHGVAGATMLVHRGRDLKPGLPYMLMYREALAAARSMDDVFAAISRARRTCSNNFMVVDATGAAEVIEYDPEQVVRRPGTANCVCSTNFFVSKELRELCVPVGEDRYESLEGFLERERGRIDLEAVQRALADVAEPWYLNVQAMVFLPAKRSLHLSVGGTLPAAKQPYVHIPADVLFGK
jgi:hypothetical protein